MARKAPALAICALVVAGMGGECMAAYDLDVRTEDYARETLSWFPVIFTTEVENTGDQDDTIDLVLTKDAPPVWSYALCIDGDCIPSPAYIHLQPGEVETVEVIVYVGGSDEMGLVMLTASMRGDPSKVKRETYAAFVNLPSFMLVDDDAGASHETYLQTAIENAGYEARVWNADSLGRPGAVQLNSYWGVFWTTADGDVTYLTSGDEGDIIAYLDNGGNLFLSSMDFLSSRGGVTTFTADYLHIDQWTSDTGASAVSGVPGDPVSDGMSLSLLGGPFSADDTDSMTLDIPADSIFLGPAGISGLKVEENGHKVVFLSFPFEDISTSDPDPDNQTTVISRVIDWFAPPPAGVDESVGTSEGGVVLGRNFPNPFAGSTEISFAAHQTSRQVEIAIYNVNGRVVRSLHGEQGAGSRGRVVWDGTDDAGVPVASGVYFYRLSGDGAGALHKMVLLK